MQNYNKYTLNKDVEKILTKKGTQQYFADTGSNYKDT